MGWILEHLQLLIFIGGAIAWWLNQRARENAGDGADYDGDGRPDVPPRGVFEDPELAERTRRIREEIQRRIAERRRAGGGYTEPARPVAAPLEPPLQPVLEPPPLVREVVVRSSTREDRWDSRRTAEILEQQAALAEKLQEAEDMKAAAQRRLAYEAKVAASSHREEAALTTARGNLLGELRGADNLRRAFVLREVLGPPVGLR